MTGTERYQSCSCMAGAALSSDDVADSGVLIGGKSSALESGRGRRASQEEDPDGRYDSQLLPATNFSSNGEIEVVKDDDQRDASFFSPQLFEALIWLILLVFLWTLNIIVFKKVSSASPSAACMTNGARSGSRQL